MGLESGMKANLITTTVVTIAIECPHCGKPTGSIGSLIEAREANPNYSKEFGPWHCDRCGKSYKGTLNGPDDIQIEKTGGRCVEVYDLVVIEPRDKPIYFVVSSWRWPNTGSLDPEGDGNKAYYYDSGTCPTNWIKQVESIIYDENDDPHGIATFVATIDKDKAVLADWGDNEPDFVGTFPEVRGQQATARGRPNPNLLEDSGL